MSLSRPWEDLNRPAVAAWVKIAAVESVELIGIAGYDAVVIDLEHSTISTETASAQIAFALASGLCPYVRVTGPGDPAAGKLLDAGAYGVLFPHVDSVGDARWAAAAVRFPPIGRRGASAATRAGAWGTASAEQFLRAGRDLPVCIVQIESRSAVEAADDIAAVEGVDMLFLGTVDLAVELGRHESDDEVLTATGRAMAAARRNGKAVGAGATGPSWPAQWPGSPDLVLAGNDAAFLRSGAAAARGALPTAAVGGAGWRYVETETRS